MGASPSPLDGEQTKPKRTLIWIGMLDIAGLRTSSSFGPIPATSKWILIGSSLGRKRALIVKSIVLVVTASIRLALREGWRKVQRDQ